MIVLLFSQLERCITSCPLESMEIIDGEHVPDDLLELLLDELRAFDAVRGVKSS